MGSKLYKRQHSGRYGRVCFSLSEKNLLVIVVFNLCCGWWAWVIVNGTPSEEAGPAGYPCPPGDCAVKEQPIRALKEINNHIIDKHKDFEPLVNTSKGTDIRNAIVVKQLVTLEIEKGDNNIAQLVAQKPIIRMTQTEPTEHLIAKPLTPEPNVSHKQFFGVHQESSIHYSAFMITEPLFISKTDKNLFYKIQENGDILNASLGKQYLHGVVRVIKNGWVTQGQNCGWKTDLSQFETEPISGTARLKSNILCPLLVPEGCTFRHFIDGTLPKIIQAMEYLVYKDTVLLMPGKCDRIVMDMLNIMGFSVGQIKTVQKGNYPSHYQINTCIAPPFHPSIWNKTRHILGVPEKLVDTSTSNVILFVNGHLGTRRTKILNMNQVIKVLIKKFTSKRVFILKDTDITLSNIRHVFSKAKIIVGLSSDLIYSILFAPRNSSVVEIMAGRKTGHVLPSGVDHSMTWKLASTMGHAYWRDYELLSTNSGDVSVSLDKLHQILDKIEPKKT